MGSGEQDAWVARVLGFEVGAEGSPSGAGRAKEAAAEIAVGMGNLSMAFRKARLEWGGARREASAAIRGLQARLREVLGGEADFPAIEREIGKFDGIVEGLDGRLEDALDRAMNASDPEAQAVLKRQARTILADYIAFVSKHPFLRKIDGNEFMPSTVYATLVSKLQSVAKTLA